MEGSASGYVARRSARLRSFSGRSRGGTFPAELDGHGPEVCELRPVYVVRADRHEAVQRSRQDDVAASQPTLWRDTPVAQPGKATDRITECGRTRPALDRCPVAVQKQPDQAQVDVGGRSEPATED